MVLSPTRSAKTSGPGASRFSDVGFSDVGWHPFGVPDYDRERRTAVTSGIRQCRPAAQVLGRITSTTVTSSWMFSTERTVPLSRCATSPGASTIDSFTVVSLSRPLMMTYPVSLRTGPLSAQTQGNTPKGRQRNCSGHRGSQHSLRDHSLVTGGIEGDPGTDPPHGQGHSSVIPPPTRQNPARAHGSRGNAA